MMGYNLTNPNSIIEYNNINILAKYYKNTFINLEQTAIN